MKLIAKSIINKILVFNTFALKFLGLEKRIQYQKLVFFFLIYHGLV